MRIKLTHLIGVSLITLTVAFSAINNASAGFLGSSIFGNTTSASGFTINAVEIAPTTTNNNTKLNGGKASLQPTSAPRLYIGMPAHGAALYDNINIVSPWYNPATGRIQIRGEASGVPAVLINSGRLQILIDGQSRGTITASNAANQQIWFEGETTAWINRQWVQRSVLVELVNPDTGNVVARDTNTYYDLRREGLAVVDAAPGKLHDGMSLQLTDSGIGETLPADIPQSLEVPHLAMLPYPDMGEFDDELTEAARGAAYYDDDANVLDACISMTEVDRGFRSSPAYFSAFAEATGYYAAYEAWERVGESACSSIATSLSSVNPWLGAVLNMGCSIAMNNWCVKEPPALRDFELCVDQLEGHVTELSIDSVSDVQLAWAESDDQKGTLISNTTLDGVRGRVDGLLRDLNIRWVEDGCNARPTAAISDDELDNGDWLEDFATCADIEVEAEQASTTASDGSPAEFTVQTHAVFAEQLEVKQAVAGEMRFVNTEVDAEKGVCAESFMLTYAEDMALTYADELETALNEAWNSGATRTQQAVALEQLLSPLNLGLYTPSDYDFLAELETPGSEPDGGAQFSWHTKIDATDKTYLTPGFFLHPAQYVPYFEDGHDDWTPFDLSFTLTTGYLNQILHVKGATDLLHFNYQPTWGDLARFGATAANTGYPADQPPPLNGTVLSHIDQSFAALGSTELQIRIQPSLNPLVWMNPDPPQDLLDPVTGAPLAFGIGGLEIVFEEPPTFDPIKQSMVPGAVWMELKFTGWDWDFSLAFDSQPTNLLVPSYNSDDWGLSIQYTLLTGCPKVPHGNFEPPVNCERALEGALLGLFEPLILPRLLSMLTEIPAPQVWGESNHTVQVDSLHQTKMDQNITFYKDVPND